jgi:hypothetical protein
MFNLIYRDGAPENTGHYEVFEKNDGSGSALAVGQLVSVTNGIASKYDASGKPYGVVAISAADGEDSVAVLRITDDMIFSASLTGSASIGGALKPTDSGVGTSVTSGYGFEVTEIVSDKFVKGRFVNLDA